VKTREVPGARASFRRAHPYATSALHGTVTPSHGAAHLIRVRVRVEVWVRVEARDRARDRARG